MLTVGSGLSAIGGELGLERGRHRDNVTTTDEDDAMNNYIQTVLCPQCHKTREIKGNTASIYKRLCRRCAGQRSAARNKISIALPGSEAPGTPTRTTYQKPCVKGQSHHWDLSNGIDNALCLNGCRQKPAPGRWTAEIPTGTPRLLEKHVYAPAWGLTPTMEVKTW